MEDSETITANDTSEHSDGNSQSINSSSESINHVESQVGAEAASDLVDVAATGLTLVGELQTYYENVELMFKRTGLQVIVAPAGLGRDALMMSLAGRLKPTSGQLTVCGATRPQKIIKFVGLAGLDQIDHIDPSVTVRALLTEHMRWLSPWFHIVRKLSDDSVVRILEPVFGELEIPSGGTLFENLRESQAMLLKIALAELSNKAVLLVGDLDQVKGRNEKIIVAKRLIEFSRNRLVIAGSADPLGISGNDYLEHYVSLGTHPNHSDKKSKHAFARR